LSPGLLAAAIVMALFALIPARRLFAGGYSTTVIAIYFVGLWLLGFLVAVGPGRTRLVMPILLVLYVVPFMPWRAALARLFGRDDVRRLSPARNVTPQPEHEEPSIGS
jgi:hypothetical protein